MPSQEADPVVMTAVAMERCVCALCNVRALRRPLQQQLQQQLQLSLAFTFVYARSSFTLVRASPAVVFGENRSSGPTLLLFLGDG